MLKLAFDVTTRKLVSWQGSVTSLPAFSQEIDDVELRFVEPNPDQSDGAETFAAIDLTDILGPRLGIWSNSTGTLDDSSTYLLALTPHDAFTLNTDDADDPYYSGTFDTKTPEMAAEMDTAKTLAAYFAVGLVRTNITLKVVYDHKGSANCTVYSATDDASGALAVSASGGIRFITLPQYYKSADGLRHYVLTENETQDGVVFSQYSP